MFILSGLLCCAAGCATVNMHSHRDCDEVSIVRTPESDADSVPSAGQPRSHQIQSVTWETGELIEDDLADPARSQPEVPSEPEQLPLPEGNEDARRKLSLEEIERLALSNNPAVAEHRAAVDAARGTLLQVGLKPNPRIGYAGEDIGIEGSAGKHGLFVAQEIVTGGKLDLNRQIAAWQVERAEQELQALNFRVLTDARIAYYEALIAQRRGELAKELVEVSQKAFEAAQTLFEGKEVSQADPLRTQIEVDAARIVRENARRERSETWRRLAILIGADTSQPVPLDGELEAGELDMTWDETLQKILSQNPQIAAAMARVESARWIIQREIAEVQPNVDVRAVVQHDDVSGNAVAGLEFELPLPIYNRNQGAIQRAYFDMAGASQAVDRIALHFESTLSVVYQKYSSAQHQVQQYSREGGIIDNAEKSLNLLRSGYQAGEFDLLAFLAAQRTYFETNLAYLDSLHRYWTAVAEIRGLLLRGSLHPG